MPESPEDMKQIETKTLPKRRAPNYISTYANQANLAASFFDARLIFSEMMVEATKTAEGITVPLVMEEKVAISMSWEHVKGLAVLLAKRVEDYEKRYGQLRKQPEKIIVEG